MGLKKNWSIILGFAIVVLLVGTVLVLNTPKPQTIKLGVILPLTGNGSDQGEWNRKGLELAKDEINVSRIHGQKIELVYDDSKGGKPAEATLAYQNLHDLYSVPVVFSWGSGVGIALTPLANRDTVIQMGLATTSPDYSTPSDFSFRLSPSATAEGAFGARFLIEKKKLTRVSVLFVENDYGVGSQKAFSQAFEQLRGTVLSSDSVPVGVTDVRTQLQKIKQQNPQAVYLAVYPKEGGIILKQAKELDLNVQFLASTAILAESELFEIAGDAANGLVVTTSQFNPDSEEPAVSIFSKAYFSKYAEKPTIYSAWGYDGLRLIAKAMDSCESASDTECIKNALLSTQEYAGASGVISFDPNGDVLKEFQILQVQNQKFVPLAN